MNLMARISFVCLLSGIISACSSSTPSSELQPQEVKLSDAPASDAPEGQSFFEAKQLYRAGLYSVAQDSFDSLRLNYPTSPYAEFAEIKVADSHFSTKDYIVAAGLYEEFTKNHPASKAVPYMLMQAGLSHYLTNSGIGRDVAPLEKALALFDRVIEQHPNTVYAQEAARHRSATQDRIAAYERSVIDFYRKRGKVKATVARESIFKEKFSDVALASLAVDRVITDPPRPLPLTNQHRPAPPNLMLVRDQSKALPLQSANNNQVLAKMKSPNTSIAAQHAIPSSSEAELNLQRVNCSDGKVFIHLDSPITDSIFITRYRHTDPSNGSIAIQLPNQISKELRLNCFGKADFSVARNGEIRLETNRSADVLTLNNPPRLLVILN